MKMDLYFVTDDIEFENVQSSIIHVSSESWARWNILKRDVPLNNLPELKGMKSKEQWKN